mgnify:CR=1 FL=1
MKVQLDAELVMELRADCPEEDRLVVGGNDWGFRLKAVILMEKSSVDAWFQAEQTGIWASAAIPRKAFILELYLLNISFRRMTVFTLQSKT